jgi:cystathionine beta-lyase/cystathionine gamma-synthase
MLKRLKLIVHAPSLAGVETLVSEPRLTSHKGIGVEGRTKIGIPDGFLRLSCGIEDAQDIIGDLEQGLKGEK